MLLVIDTRRPVGDEVVRMVTQRALRRAACALILACTAFAVVPLDAPADPPLSVKPDAGPSGALVSVTPGFTKESPCALELDNHLVESFTCGPEVSVQFKVDGSPGPHTITVCASTCDGIDPSESAPFTITLGSTTSVSARTTGKTQHASRARKSSVTVGPVVTTTDSATASTVSKSLTARYGDVAVVVLVLLFSLVAGLVVRYVRGRGRWPPVGPAPTVVTRATGAGVGMRSLRTPPRPTITLRTSRSATLAVRKQP